jgi:hypothetical protein
MGQGWTIFLAVCVFSTAARADTVTFTAAQCRQLTAHTPAKDVEYKPGVDVHGKAVTPADLGGGYNIPTMTPEDISIPITIDLADRLGRSRARQQGNTDPTTADRPLLKYAGEVPVGTVTFQGNTALWNGEPLAPQDQAVLAAGCRARLEGAIPPPPKPEQPR